MNRADAHPIDPPRPTHFYPFFPVTLLLLAMMLVAASITGAYAEGLSRPALELVGFPPRTFAAGELYRIVTSAFATHGPRVLSGGLLMVGLSVGLAEWTVGSLGALLGFWLIHTLSLLVVYSGGAALEAIVPVMDAATATRIPDVGPSAGYFGCLGLALGVLSRSARIGGRFRAELPIRPEQGATWVACVVLGWLVLDLTGIASPGPALATEVGADWAHLVAFSMGVGAGRWMGRRATRTRASS